LPSFPAEIMATDNNGFSLQEKHLLCPYCFAKLQNPVKLPCGHNVCEECLAELTDIAVFSKAMKEQFSGKTITADQIKCPVCFKLQNIGDEVPNDELREIIETENEKCDECGKAPVKFYCQQCGIFYGKKYACFCESCLEERRSSFENKGHKPTTKHPLTNIMEKVGFNGSLNSAVFPPERSMPICPKHGLAVTIKNTFTKELLCPKCVEHLKPTERRNEQKIQSVLAQSARVIVGKDKILKETMIGKAGIEKYLGICESKISASQKSRISDLESVNDYIDDYIALLEKIRKDKIAEINAVYNKHDKHLVQLKKECESLWEEIEEMDEFVEAALELDDYFVCIMDERLTDLRTRYDSIVSNVSVHQNYETIFTDLKFMDFPKEESLIKFTKAYRKRKGRSLSLSPEPTKAASSDPALDLLRRALDKHTAGDHSRATELYSEAAQKGSQLACFNLGFCCMFGIGVPKDSNAAIDWWKRGGTVDERDIPWMKELSNDRVLGNDKLDFVWNSIGTEGANALREGLKINTSITTISLLRNNLGDEAAVALEALKINSTVTEIDLRGNSIHYAGAKIIGDTLKSNFSVVKLDLSWNNIGPDGAAALAEGLKENETITEIYVGCNKIGAEGAKAMGDVLRENSSITYFNLRYNNIGDEGTKALAEGMKHNSTIMELQLYDNNIGDEGANSLADSLRVNSSLTSLFLYDNSIGNAGAKSLGSALEENSTLQTLSLYDNTIGDAGAHDLAESLKKNKALTSLNVGENYIGEEGERELQAIEHTGLTISFYADEDI